MGQAIFISGTDTGVGKTAVTSWLKAAAIQQGLSTETQKWIQCGDLTNKDLDKHDQKSPSQNKSVYKSYSTVYNPRSPYEFSTPASPHLAAEIENQQIDKQRIIAATQELQSQTELLLIEGAGGLSVPYSRDELLIDLVRELDLPILLVVDNRVGCINHSLLSIEAIRSRQCHCLGLIFTHSQDPGHPEAAWVQDNIRTIQEFSGIPVLAHFPHNPSEAKALDIATAALKKISTHINSAAAT